MVLAIVVLPVPGGPYKKIDVPEITEAPIRDSISSDKTSWQNALSTSDGFNATRRTLCPSTRQVIGKRNRCRSRVLIQRQQLRCALLSLGACHDAMCTAGHPSHFAELLFSEKLEDLFDNS